LAGAALGEDGEGAKSDKEHAEHQSSQLKHLPTSKQL
jgi:hypothetical protein